MPVFDKYAAYYDLLYRDKAYKAEASYVHDLLLKHGDGQVRRLLDLGCGTGRHAAILAGMGYTVQGVDQSERMIDRARVEHKAVADCRFEVGDIRDYRSPESFDAVLSLFHVMSYQVDNASLLNAMQTAADHLESGGLFLFDFWYGPAVLSDLPTERTKMIEDAQWKLVRHSTPSMHYNQNRVDVQFDVTMEEQGSSRTEQIQELHQMRYLFLPELEAFLDRKGFDILSSYEWMGMDPPSEQSWNVVLIARKR